MRLQDEVTEPGAYFFLMENQGGHPSWRWFQVYKYPKDKKEPFGEMELYCSEIAVGHQGVNHTKIDELWNVSQVERSPSLETALTFFLELAINQKPDHV